MHLIDNASGVGKILSCFVCERKHRLAKRTALYVYRHLEHTVTADLVDRHCVAMSGDTSLFLRAFLVNPHAVTIGNARLQQSVRAVLPCGEVQNNDIVYTQSGIVSKVMKFWHGDGNYFIVQLDAYTSIGGSAKVWCTRSPSCQFTIADDILDTLIWVPLTNDNIRIVPPFTVEGATL